MSARMPIGGINSIPIGDTVHFINPDDGMQDVGELVGRGGGLLKVMTDHGVVFLLARDLLRGGRKNRKSRKNRNRKNRKSRRN